MPVSLLIALFLAFGIDVPAGPRPIPRVDLFEDLGETLGGLALVGALAFGLGRFVAARVSRQGYATSALRRRYSWGVRLIELLTLGVYAGILYEARWPVVVRSGFGLGETILVDDLLILLPFFLAQLLGWWGLYAAERALRPAGTLGALRVATLGRFLTLKVRHSLGLILPGVLVFSLGQDLARHQWPRWASATWTPLAAMAALGLVVLLLSPVFVRLAWPTRPLPPGPLRDRLEHLAHRFGFRCTDILVWDTGNVLVNAGVTGALPWFRYVLLTDTLIESLNPLEIAAVFGHEIGHSAHHHLYYLGFFFVGSLGVMALLEGAIDSSLIALPAYLLPAGWSGDSMVVSIVQAVLALLGLAFYFLVVFGHVSRRFERQADVFGCRTVSCGLSACPPHADPDHPLGHLPVSAPAPVRPSPPAPSPASVPLCPVGIRIFANALANVAALNGIEQSSRFGSWRHGSIRRRIAFLESLEGRPDAERRFQAAVGRLRLVVALVLVAALVYAVGFGAAAPLR
jgi:STE24 endopeptidase